MKIKVSDYVFSFLRSKMVDTIFSVSGGTISHLLDSIDTTKFTFVCNAHEQACAMSAEGYGRINNKPAVVLVTNGPGSTNTLTGIVGAYQDSIPMIVISGQSPTSQTLQMAPNIRQYGVQECNIIEIVKSVTKFATSIRNTDNIKELLEEAYIQCISGRMGPVWIEIPIDIQSKLIEDDIYVSQSHVIYDNTSFDIDSVISLICSSKRPLIVTGNGIHLSSTEKQFLDFVETLQIPVISSWTSKDIFDYNNPLFIGNYGLLGERSANFAVQTADLLIILGSRMSITNVGYNTELFSPNSKKIMVDIDKHEMAKPSIKIDVPINVDLKSFFRVFSLEKYRFNAYKTDPQWTEKLSNLKSKYSVFDEPHTLKENRINSFQFIKLLSEASTNEVIVTDMGTAYTCTMQAFRTNGNNRLFTSSACCSMGFGLPGSIGVAINNKNRVICIAGDGGFQMNIQELQTIAHYNIPIKMFILNNNAYLAISLMQDNLFNGKRVGSDIHSGVSSPDFVKVAEAYKINAKRYSTIEELEVNIKDILNYDGPFLCELQMVENQLLIPRVQSKKDREGNIISGTLHNMFPYQPDDVIEKIMKNE